MDVKWHCGYSNCTEFNPNHKGLIDSTIGRLIRASPPVNRRTIVYFQTSSSQADFFILIIFHFNMYTVICYTLHNYKTFSQILNLPVGEDKLVNNVIDFLVIAPIVNFCLVYFIVKFFCLKINDNVPYFLIRNKCNFVLGPRIKFV